ncbi:MAG: hypothetical protein JSS87_10530 [Acidobacteria bacterium]|nr:hypothetical protein [Acidobacteriota bacterium]
MATTQTSDRCITKASRLVRTLQVLSSLFIMVLALLPGFVGAANLFFYIRNVTRITDWSLLALGAALLLLGLISLAKPKNAARWISLIAVIGFAVVLATATGVMQPITADTNIALLCAGAFFLIFLMSRYLARPHFQNGAACSHCGH